MNRYSDSLRVFDPSLAGLSHRVDSSRSRVLRTLLVAAVVCSLTAESSAQRRPMPTRNADADAGADSGRSTSSASATVTINYPDSVSLASFVDYVSRRMKVRILFGDEIKNQTVVFRPGEVEVESDELLELLRGILRLRGLALVEADLKGWFRIVQDTDLQRHVTEIRTEVPESTYHGSNRVVAQILEIHSADYGRIVNQLRGFLSSPKASIIEIPERRAILVVDYEAAIKRAMRIAELLDVSTQEVLIEPLEFGGGSASEFVKRLEALLSARGKIAGASESAIQLVADELTQRVFAVGRPQDIESIRTLAESISPASSADHPTEMYAPSAMSVARLDRLIQDVLVGTESGGDGVRTVRDDEANRLYVTGPEELHSEIRTLIASQPVGQAAAAQPLRVYTPRNRLARDLLTALSKVLPKSYDQARTPQDVPGAPAGEESGSRVDRRRPTYPGTRGRALGTERSDDLPAVEPARIDGPDFTLAVDEHTNSILAIGAPEFHARLTQLIEVLDRRLPQVVIEMTLVAMTFNDSLSFSIELANEEMPGDLQSLFFSSFGISSIDLTTGARVLNPGGGLNGIILGPHETPIVMRAISAHGDSRVITTPKAIVSDNTTASISSVSEEPFTSVNASDTVATTSFAGFESAGTTLTVTPHIAQGDHLRLDYSFSFSNFTGSGDVGVPPPRASNNFSGVVEIPDGHTIVIGGLVTENESDSVTEVPILGRIPVIGALFQSSDRARSKTRVFAFIRARVLRDDQFADLKSVSRTELERAELANHGFPDSEYAWMR